MNYWFVWPAGIVIWLVIGWAAFAWFESRALKHDARKDQITLSMFCYTVGSKFPLSIFILGLFVGLFWGILATHFNWHWCPAGSINEGFLMQDKPAAIFSTTVTASAGFRCDRHPDGMVVCAYNDESK